MADVRITTTLPCGHGVCECSRKLFAMTVAAFTACSAQAKLDVATERQYGGVYSNACGDPRGTVAQVLRRRDDGRARRQDRDGQPRAGQEDPHHGPPDPDFKAVITDSVAVSSDGLDFALRHNAQGLSSPPSKAARNRSRHWAPAWWGRGFAIATPIAMPCPAPALAREIDAQGTKAWRSGR